MSMNQKIINKYKNAYKDLQPIIPAIEFDKESEYYDEEYWLPVSNLYVPNVIENVYKISTHGRVYSEFKAKKFNNGFLEPSLNSHNYRQVNLRSIYNKNICVKIARLVMLHFRFRPDCYLLEVDHIDGNKENNHLYNLEWVTPQENTHRAIKNNLRKISCNSNSDILLSNDQAYDLYNKILNGIDINILSEEYNVSTDYINKLKEGVIRPYIANKYYKNHAHTNIIV